MNLVFWFLIILGLIISWFLISFVFIPLGSVFVKKWNSTIEIINKETNNEEEKETKND